MSNVEIYDSSNSQLSSDEYSHDEDDDALMDVAVSKQQTPTKSTKSQTSSSETSPDKSSSSATTPRKSSSDLDAGGTIKAPTTREHTQRQIKQMQRNIKANLYFKRRSIKWLNERVINKSDYGAQLKRAIPRNHERSKRMAEYRAAKRAIGQEQLARQHHHLLLQKQKQQQLQRRERTPSRSRSGSPELICLDDTENEESPEKPTTSSAASGRQLTSKTPPPYNLKLDVQTVATPTANGSLLEFLTLKPAGSAAEPTIVEPISEPDTVCNDKEQCEQLDLSTLIRFKAGEPLLANSRVDAPMEDSTLKRRRSSSPATCGPKDIYTEKRNKPIPTEEVDDDIIEFVPNDLSQKAGKQPPISQSLLTSLNMPPVQRPPILTKSAAAPASRLNVEALSTPKMKIGSSYTLTPSSGMDFINQQRSLFLHHQQLQQQQQQQQQQQLQQQQQQHQQQQQQQLQQQRQSPESPVAISFSLQTTPTPPVEPMEIVYPNDKSLNAQEKTAAVSVNQVETTPMANQQDAPRAATSYAAQEEPPQPLNQLPLPQQQPSQQQVAQQQMPQQQQQQASQQPLLHQAPLQQQSQQQPPQQQSHPKARIESSSRQTQSTQTARNKTAVDLNSSNSDAVFHQRVKELYTELDEIMTDKMRAVKPELKSYCEEKQRIEADIKTLDNLIRQKEEEHNRLLHLRCIKEELRARLERKERLLIVKEILPSIFNKNCSTSELYEMHSMLMNEQNAPMPSQYGGSIMEHLINKVENGLGDIKLLRKALGLQEKIISDPNILMPPPHFEAPAHRRNSLPAMRPPPPPVTGDRSVNYGRQGAVRDVRSLIEDFRREHPEELPLVGKRNKLQPPPHSRYQELINESKQLTNSTPDLAATPSYRNKQHEQLDTNRSHPNLLDNHFDNEIPSKPLYNSSPLGNTGQHRKETARVNQTNSHSNDLHSIFGAELLQAWNPVSRTASQLNSSNNKSHRMSATANGPDDMDRRCQQCHRYTATYMCAGCQNQWYCSRQCQVLAWDTHYKTCDN